MQFSYRKATVSDSLQLSILYKQVYIYTYGKEGVSLEFANFMEKQFAVEKIEADVRSATCDIWLALYKSNPVGVIQIEYNRRSPAGALVATEINKLYILSHFHSKGIGQALMQKAEEVLRKKGHKQVWLWVLASNRTAIQFYEKQGYHWIGDADFKMEVNNYHNKVMSKQL